MWHTEHTIDTELAAHAVWQALIAIESGTVPMASGDLRSLNGNFELGATITSTPVGIDPVQSTITEMVQDQVLAVQTNFGSLVLLLRHTLEPVGESTRVTRRLEVSGPDEQVAVAGPRISEDYDEALSEIVAVAENFA
jgi:hypothetical protein